MFFASMPYTYSNTSNVNLNPLQPVFQNYRYLIQIHRMLILIVVHFLTVYNAVPNSNTSNVNLNPLPWLFQPTTNTYSNTSNVNLNQCRPILLRRKKKIQIHRMLILIIYGRYKRSCPCRIQIHRMLILI